MRYPLVAPLAAFAAGILAAQLARFNFPELLISISLLALLALLGLRRGAPWGGVAACLAGFCLAGAMWASLPSVSSGDAVDVAADRMGLNLAQPVRARGWVREPPVVRADRDQFVLAVESVDDVPACGGVRVTAIRRPGEPPLELHYGERVEFLARLRRLHNFENPGGFDRVQYLRRQDIRMTATLRSGVQPLPGRGGSRWRAAVWSAREWTDRRTDALLGAGSIRAGVVKAMVFGNPNYLDRELGKSFQRTGTYHALVVSGLHAAIIGGFLFALLRLAGVAETWGAPLSMILLVGFVQLAGSQLPTIRGALMVGAYLLGRLLYRERRALNMIAAAAFIMLLVDPQDLFDVSFQLSFLAVGLIAGIAVPLLERTVEPYERAARDLPNEDLDLHLSPKMAQTRIAWRMLAERLPVDPRNSMRFIGVVVRGLAWAAAVVVVSAVVQLGLSLPMAAYFHRISASGLSANLIVAPLMSAIVPLGFAAVATGWAVLGQVLSATVAAMIAVVEWHARLTGLEARVPSPPLWLAVLFSAALIAVAWALEKRWRTRLGLAAAALAAVTAALVIHPFAPRLERGRLEITALDVGQGESIFLGLPNGQTMLLDGAGLATFGRASASALDVGEDVVSPYLWSRSVRTLDVVAISHAHYDHIGGLPALLDNFQVRELWVGNNPATPDYDRVLEAVRRRGVRLVRLAAGEERSLGAVVFQVLWPPPDYVPRSRPSNNDSLVLRARFGERSFLLAGDIERLAETRMLAGGVLQHADVLKVPHHGSKTSTGDWFLEATRPWFAVVSAGFDNPYGHPHPDVLQRLVERRSHVLRTDRDGGITVSTDGHRIFVSTNRWERTPPKPVWSE